MNYEHDRNCGCCRELAHILNENDKDYEKLQKENEQLKASILNASELEIDYCPFCGKDTRKKYDCKTCNIDHMSKECLRDGKHADDCIWFNEFKKNK